MSFSYSGNPASSVLDEVRFTIGDTDSNAIIMQDEEVQYLIDNYTGYALYYQAFIRAATLFARDIKRTLGPQSEDPTARLKFFQEQAEYYKNKLVSAGLSVPMYSYPKVFHKGMDNNPPWPGGKNVP